MSVEFRNWDEKKMKEDFASQTHSVQTTEDASETKMQALRVQRELGSAIVTSKEDSDATTNVEATRKTVHES